MTTIEEATVPEPYHTKQGRKGIREGCNTCHVVAEAEKNSRILACRRMVALIRERDVPIFCLVRNIMHVVTAEDKLNST